MTMLEQRFMEIVPKALYKLAEQSKRIADALENQNRLLAQGKTAGTQPPLDLSALADHPKPVETVHAQ